MHRFCAFFSGISYCGLGELKVRSLVDDSGGVGRSGKLGGWNALFSCCCRVRKAPVVLVVLMARVDVVWRREACWFCLNLVGEILGRL